MLVYMNVNLPLSFHKFNQKIDLMIIICVGAWGYVKTQETFNVSPQFQVLL